MFCNTVLFVFKNNVFILKAVYHYRKTSFLVSAKLRKIKFSHLTDKNILLSYYLFEVVVYVGAFNKSLAVPILSAFYNGDLFFKVPNS